MTTTLEPPQVNTLHLVDSPAPSPAPAHASNHRLSLALDPSHDFMDSILDGKSGFRTRLGSKDSASSLKHVANGRYLPRRISDPALSLRNEASSSSIASSFTNRPSPSTSTETLSAGAQLASGPAPAPAAAPAPFGSLPASISAQTLSSRSPHRRHAHRRSGAVSHDLKDLKMLDGKVESRLSKLSVESLVDEPCPPLKPPQVQFKLDQPNFSTVSLPAPPASQSMVSLSTLAAAPASPPAKRRHKKVKSWAGSLIKFRSKRSSQSDDGRPPLTEPYSSSYIPVTLTVTSPSDSCAVEDEFEPTIDLDAALGLRRSLADSSRQFLHRRTESAPGLMPTRSGMKRKMGPVLEEDTEPSNTTFAEAAQANAGRAATENRIMTERSANSSAVSLVLKSKASGDKLSVVQSTSDEQPPPQKPAASAALPPTSAARSARQPSDVLAGQATPDTFFLGEPGPEVRSSFEAASVTSRAPTTTTQMTGRSARTLRSARLRNMWGWVKNKF